MRVFVALYGCKSSASHDLSVVLAQATRRVVREADIGCLIDIIRKDVDIVFCGDGVAYGG